MTQADIGLVASHNIGLVVLSVVIAIIASYTALNLAGRVTVAQGHTRILLWLTGGAIAMGVGIWSMHFIAMLAYNLPIRINYNLPIVLVSMVVAIIASGVALFVVSRPSMDRLQLLTGGVFMGLGVAAMHYTGMAAMQLEATPVYNPQLVTLSIGIAIAASLIAMRLAFDLRADATSVSAWKLSSAIIMGNAIAGMHYTAMAAVNFYPTQQVVDQLSSSIDTYFLGIGIGIATLIILTLALTTSLFEQRISVETAKAEVLRQSEERFRSLVQNASDIIVVIAADGTVNYASPTIKSILGYEPDAWKNAFEFVHPDDITKAESLLTKALHSESVNIAAQFRLKHADGQTRDFEVIANNLLSEPGVAGILTTYRDITQRKQAEVALQQQIQRERLVDEIAQRIRSSLNLEEILSTTVAEVRQFFQTERVFIYRFEPDWSGVVVVESVAPGWSPLLGMKVKDLFFAEVANRDLYKQDRVKAIEDIYTANLSQYHIDFLSDLQVRANLVVTILQEQHLWGLLVVNQCSEPRQWQQLEINLLKQLAIRVAIAIQQSTLFQQVQTELGERQRTEVALRESEEKFRNLVEQTNDWIWEIDRNGVFTYVSPQVRQILGYEPAEILGKTTFDFMAVDVEVKRFSEVLESFISVQKPFICLEKTLIHKDGHPVILESSGSPMFDCQQVFQGYRGIARDITERKRAEAQITKLNADLQRRALELEAANKELEAFSYSVSHDLRAPLRAINGFSRILSNEYAPQIPPKARRYLQMVQDNAQQMGCLVDDLLAFSRLSRSPLNKQAVAPSNIVRQVFTDLSHEQENRHIEITIDELPECQADPALLKQVWINLIANALKYTRQQEVACIQVGYQLLNTKRVYFVQDNGVGFDMRYAHKLFGVFQRLHRAEDYEGTGVGLAIVQRIIHRHGGSVWAEAEVNKGATFYFSLEENYDDRDGGRNPLSGGQSLRCGIDTALLEKQ